MIKIYAAYAKLWIPGKKAQKCVFSSWGKVKSSDSRYDFYENRNNESCHLYASVRFRNNKQILNSKLASFNIKNSDSLGVQECFSSFEFFVSTPGSKKNYKEVNFLAKIA